MSTQHAGEAGHEHAGEAGHEHAGEAGHEQGVEGGQLKPGLKDRHVTMIAIAGVIGAGLFVGSASAIQLAGPAVIISYLLAGTLVVLVMRMLGEMATANPDTGSFSTYADRALGRWAGFSIGWLYWWFWVIVIPFEANAGALIIHGWTDIVPIWVYSLVITALLVGTNLWSVGNYGEFEFWFALVKVLAIIAFLVLGLLAIVGVLPGAKASGIGGFWEQGGFLPEGPTAILAAMLVTVFTFMGTEIVTIAAAESPDPARGVRKAVNSVIWRISLFYIGSIFVVVALANWSAKGFVGRGSYQATLDAMGLPGWTATALEFVIVTAVLSCLNSAMYTASRMAYSLSRRGDAPRAWSRVTSRGVPAQAILWSSVFAFVGVILNYVFPPEQVFEYLLKTSGAVALFVWLVVAVSQLRMRAEMDRRGERPPVRMWLYPGLTYGVIAFILFTLVMMGVMSGQRLELFLSLALAVVVTAIAIWRQRREQARAVPDRGHAGPEAIV